MAICNEAEWRCITLKKRLRIDSVIFVKHIIKAIVTLAEGATKVYGLLEGQGLDRRNDMARAF